MESHSDSIDSYKQPSGIGYSHYCPPACPACLPHTPSFLRRQEPRGGGVSLPLACLQ